jgi:hypothetical protein
MSNLITIDKLGDMIKYTCNLSKSYIVFLINPLYIFHDECDFNWNEPKLVINLLNIAFNDILNNYSNITKFRYYVDINDSENIDKTRWVVIDSIDTTILLECSLKDAFDNIMDGFK